MNSDFFMPMGLDTLQDSYTAKTRETSKTSDTQGAGSQQSEDTFGLNFEDFLLLMVQQLQNQTIDNTADTNEMLNQLVQMSTVQMLATVQDGMEVLLDASTMSYAASLVGKEVTVAEFDEEGNITEVVGEVTGTGTYQGTSVIFVNGKMYALSDIMAVGRLPEIEEPPTDGGEDGEDTENGDTTDPAPPVDNGTEE